MIGAGGAGRPGRRGQPAQAGPGARRAAHDRGHHLGRVQEILREGRRAARRFQVVKVEEPAEATAICDDARASPAMLEKHHRVRILDEAVERRRPALAPLHPRAAAARQVGQPARHRLRPGGDRPERRPPGRRGLPPRDRAPRGRDRRSSSAKGAPAPSTTSALAELTEERAKAAADAGRAGGALATRRKRLVEQRSREARGDAIERDPTDGKGKRCRPRRGIELRPSSTDAELRASRARSR